MTLTLIVGALCLGTAGFALRRKETAAVARAGGRRVPQARRDVDNRFEGRRPKAAPSAGRGSPKVEVQVNPGKCARFGFCEHEAPEIFNLKGDGRLGYKTTATGEQIDAVDRAMKICPARAIKMKRPGARMYMPQTGEMPRIT